MSDRSNYPARLPADRGHVDRREFLHQVREHSDMVERLLGHRPTTFRNTELVISEPLACRLQEAAMWT